MSEEPENVFVRLNFSLHLVLDLRSHQGELLLSVMGMQILSYPDELESRLFDFTNSNELTGRVWHESAQTCKHNDAPRDLNSQRDHMAGYEKTKG